MNQYLGLILALHTNTELGQQNEVVCTKVVFEIYVFASLSFLVIPESGTFHSFRTLDTTNSTSDLCFTYKYWIQW